jgi:hypothetical protein
MSDDVEVIEGHPEIPEDENKMLVPGATARIYRDGGVLEGSILVPVGRPLELRHLAPGSYVLKDEAGGYAEVAIDPKVETTLVHTRGSRRSTSKETGTAEPGSSFVVPAPVDEPPLLPIYPDEPSVETNVENDPRVDEPVLGEPGSALIEEVEDPDAPDFQLEALKGNLPHQKNPPPPVGEIEIPEAQKPKAKRDETPEPTPDPVPVVIDDRKRPVDPSDDPKAGEIAATVMPGEQVTEDPAPVNARRKQPRTAKPPKE